MADWLADAGPLAEAGLAVAKLCWGIVGKAMEALNAPSIYALLIRGGVHLVLLSLNC